MMTEDAYKIINNVWRQRHKPRHFVRDKIENAFERRNPWKEGSMDHILSWFTFSPEIIYGGLPGMGDGIDIHAAVQVIVRLLKPGGWITIFARMDDEHFDVFAEHLEPHESAWWQSGIYQFRKPLRP
jgi:hypothetical protein